MIKCFNCEKTGHFGKECTKTKSDGGKGKAFFTSTKDWMESSSETEEEEVNYALVASFEQVKSTDNSPVGEVQEPIYNFDIDDTYRLKSFLKSLHLTFKDQTFENTRLRIEIKECNKCNDFLEDELVMMNRVKEECKNAKESELIFTLKYDQMEKELAIEKQRIKNWVST